MAWSCVWAGRIEGAWRCAQDFFATGAAFFAAGFGAAFLTALRTVLAAGLGAGLPFLGAGAAFFATFLVALRTAFGAGFALALPPNITGSAARTVARVATAEVGATKASALQHARARTAELVAHRLCGVRALLRPLGVRCVRRWAAGCCNDATIGESVRVLCTQGGCGCGAPGEESESEEEAEHHGCCEGAGWRQWLAAASSVRSGVCCT